MPDEPEVLGLLALMLLHDARRAARVDDAGEIVTLEQQDRSLWNAGEIDEGSALLETALNRGQPGAYQLQAAIAACHATAAQAADTDWAAIARLYQRLAQLVPSAVVRLNGAVAVAMADGPAVGLALVDALAATGENSVEAIKRLLDSKDSEVRSTAIRALAGGGASGPWPWPWPNPRPSP